MLLSLASCGGPAFVLEHAQGDAGDVGDDAAADHQEVDFDAQAKLIDASADVVDELLEHDAQGAADVAGDVVDELLEHDAGAHAVTCSGNPPAGCACSATMVPPACAAPFSVWCAAMGESLEPECCSAQCL